MPRVQAIVLAIVVSCGLVATARAQSGESATGCLPLAVATAPQTPGQPLTGNEIVLTSISGEDVLRAELAQPMQVMPTTFPHRSIVRSLNGDYGILVTNDGSPAGKIIPLVSLAGRHSVQLGGPGFVTPDGSRFVLFHDPADLNAFLVDLESGAALPLAESLDEPALIISAAVAFGDQSLVVWTGRDIVLFDLSTGSTTDSFGHGDALGAPSFSDDGATLYFLRRGSDNLTRIVTRNVATGTERPISGQGEWFMLRQFPGDILVAQSPEGLYRIATDGTEVVLLTESAADLQPLMIDSAARNLLVRGRGTAGDGWALVDLSGAGVHDLPQISGLYLNTVDQQAVWAMLIPSQNAQPAIAGAPYVSVALGSGDTATLLEQEGNGVFFVAPGSTPDGRYGLIWDVSPALGRLWLTDAALGSSELIASSTGSAVGALSPDGCYLAVGVFDTVAEGRQGSVRVIDLATRQTTTEVTDAILLGWARL